MKKFMTLTAAAGLALGLALCAEARPRNTRRAAKQGAQKRKQPAAPAPRVEYLPSASGRSLPFSEAVRVGHMLYLSGQIGTDSKFALVPGGMKAEARQTMENVRAALERHGSSLDSVVKCTVMLADMSEWGAFNEVYAGYFRKGRLPARSALGVNGLALGARVEVECWATVE
jgi:reactive intermediate/imine deaminase